MNMVLRRELEEVCMMCGTTSEVIFHFIEEEWIIPFDKKNNYFDEEDIARLRLILDLKNQFGVNEEAIPIILHLIDQLHEYRRNLNA